MASYTDEERLQSRFVQYHFVPPTPAPVTLFFSPTLHDWHVIFFFFFPCSSSSSSSLERESESLLELDSDSDSDSDDSDSDDSDSPAA